MKVDLEPADSRANLFALFLKSKILKIYLTLEITK